MATDYGKLKVTELKDLLKERGIPQTGLSRKQQIVEALEKHDADQGVENEAAEIEQVRPESTEEADALDATQAEEAETAKQETDAKDLSPTAQGEEAEPTDLPPEKRASQERDAPPMTGEASDTDLAKEEEPPSLPRPIDAKPTVLEDNEPLSKEPSALNTPQRASPAVDSVSSDTRKRKRRSPTPPLSQESVNKKLKAAEDEELVVKLPEDRMVEDEEEQKVVEHAPVAIERTAESGTDSGKILPAASSDDVMHLDDMKETERNEILPQELGGSETELDVQGTAPAIHPATRALYIRDLVRPLPANQLRSHLLNLATPPNSSMDDSLIEAFHVDTIRTHAFAVFNSLAAAARTRSALHGRIWPEEPTRKALWVDFVPEENVERWIETEKEAEDGKGGRAGVRRWEVVYSEGQDSIVARLEEANSLPAASGPVRQQSTSSASGQGMGTPNAPVGPRGSHQASLPSRTPASLDTTGKPTPTPAPPSASFDVLDERFRHTTTKPKLYYLPKSPSIVSSRLESLAAITSREWNPEKEGSFTGSGEVRRYTFEDGDRVVDGGADIGNFGRPRGMEITSRGGRGGRGGRW